MIEEKEKFYTCRSDRTFKEVFMREDSKDILSKALEDVLKVEIKDIKFLNLERNVDNDPFVINFIIYDINMVKCKNLWYTKDEEFDKYKYLMMLDLDEEKLEDLSKKDKVVSKYMETLEEVNKDPEFREYMSAEEDARKMENSHLDEARNEGKNERNIEIAKNMLEQKIEIDVISKCTGLTAEEIIDLREENYY